MKLQDDRTKAEKAATIGFWVATDKFMSGWGRAPGKSIVACPVISQEDSETVEARFRSRKEFKRVRFVGPDWRPKYGPRDHVHIYDAKTSFRYAL